MQPVDGIGGRYPRVRRIDDVSSTLARYETWFVSIYYVFLLEIRVTEVLYL